MNDSVARVVPTLSGRMVEVRAPGALNQRAQAVSEGALGMVIQAVCSPSGVTWGSSPKTSARVVDRIRDEDHGVVRWIWDDLRRRWVLRDRVDRALDRRRRATPQP